VSFFEPPPPPERPEPAFEIPEPDPRWGAPSTELGAPVPIRVVLARTDQVAVAVVGMTAYTTGVSLTLGLRWLAHRNAEDFYADLERPFGRGAMRRPLAGELPPELRRFGVQFADGRKATTLGGPWRLGSTDDQERPEPILSRRGGGGSDRELNEQYWLWPLPPPGTLTLAFEWPSKGIELSMKEVDAGLIIVASKSSEVLWPDAHEGTGSSHATLYLRGTSAEDHPQDEVPS
jgi:hypothetical protein